MIEAPTQSEVEAAIRVLKAAALYVTTIKDPKDSQQWFIPDAVINEPNGVIAIIVPRIIE